jgi:hypothetical protein
MFKLHKLIIYTGIAALAFLCLTAFYGLTGLSFNIHKKLGITTLVFGGIHGGLLLYRNIKIMAASKK